MKKILLILSILAIIFLGGCSKAIPNANPNPTEKVPEEPIKAQQLRIVSVFEDTFSYILVPEDRANKSIYIIGDNIDGLVEEYDEVEVQGLGSGAIVKFEIIGSIYDFKLIELDWDEEKQEFNNGETIHSIEEIKDTAIFINTSLPCGMPMEVFEWKNADGKEFSVIISADGYGFNGSVIWSK